MAPKDFDPQLSSDISLDTQSGTYSKTGSGLDYLVEQALKDPGLNLRVTDADIKAGTMAAAGMNELLIMAIKATGAANDGSFSAADVHLMSDWIHTNHFATFKKLHGNDENNVETGYHLIQNDGASLNIFGDNLINQVADSIYHIGFKSSGNRLRNEDGNDNARAEKVAFWLNDIMKADLADGSLANPSKSAMTSPTSGTGLDAIVDLVTTDAGLDRHITGAEINEGAAAADTMNKIIIEGIKALGLADDKKLLTSEVYDLADWISANRLAEFKAAHGDDEGNVETAYHLVQGDGGAARLFGQNAVDTVADAIYHLGFGYRGDRLVNEDGDTNQRVELVTEWLNQILHGDLQAGTLETGKSTSNFATTGTGLDQLTDLISNEAQLNRRLPRAEVEAGAQAADAMNKIVVDGIKALGLANNGALNVSDIMDLSDWIVANHKAAWKAAHGDDENGKETGFHLVQGDGAATRSFSHNAVDTVADGIYHLGFGYKNGVVINEDGQGNARLSSTAHWLNQLLASDLNSGALTNNSVDPYPTGTTGTGLDQMVDLIVNDPGLARNYKTSELAKIATDVDGLNKILLKGIAATGIGKDGSINAIEIEVLGQWIKKNAISEWSKLRGDDDAGTGIMGLVWKGGVSQISDANAFNYFANTVYSLGYTQRYGGIVDEDDDWNGVAVDAAKWLTDLLAADLSEGSQGGASIDPSSFADALVVENGPVNVTDDDNYSVLSNSSKLKLSEGTVSFSFIAEDPTPKSTQVLFSKDAKGSNEGDVRIYFYDNQLYAKLSKAGKDHYVTIPENISPGEAHDLAFTFGSDGVAFWLDGILVEYDANIKINWLNNSNDIVIGASNEHQSAKDPTNISSHFQGEVSNFQVYDRVLNRDEIEGLSFGVTSIGTTSDDNMAGSNGQDALHGDLGQDVLSAGDGDDALYGGYGADMLKGGAGDDILDGGHGQDELMGGAGDDILLSTSDGREQTPAQLLPGYSKEPRPDNGDLDPATQKLYPNQPIPADDTLTGGSGADTFRFQFMINAKYGIIQKHARSDGSINWRGVAGENTYVHDHWVDMIGKDTITDFNRAEGDRIEIAGHTLNVEYINYHDSNSDGVDDYTIISFISKQGNGGGAHDQDDLGSLTVYGDLVTMADITQIPSATVFYGIVETIADIDEAITPLDTDPGTPRNAASPAVAQVNGPRGTADTTGQAAVSSNNVAPASRSGTGLDQLLDWIETDPGLSNRISDKDISEGSKSAAAMNGIVLEAIKATGAGNDNKIDAGDVYAMADWIKANRLSDWKKYHGDDENDVETAFHLVQGDGSAELAFGRNGINTVADAIYHLGFGYRNGRLINEDGKENERVEAVAYWLDQLLEGELRNGSLSNGGPAAAVNGTTGTGLDQLVDIIMDDEQLNRKLPNSEHDAGAKSADTMNKILVDGIKSLGLANDGTLTTSDVMALANHIKANHFAAWKAAHGDDEKSTETGFHLVQGDGAKARLFGSNAVDTVADGIYHIGFGYKNRVLVDEDGNQNAWVETVTYWLNQLLEADMSKLANPSVDPTPGGTTGTGLDQLVDLIQGDTGLNRKISLGEINGAADAANAMNDIIVKSIKATGVGNNSEISVGDVMVLADYIKSNHFNAWKAAHGDDEKGVETGFHKAQGDGGHARLFGSAGVDTVADGIYHLGFGYKNGALLNEDGNGNASLSDVAGWLTGLLKSDLADGSLNNPDKTLYVSGSTGTGLDVLVNMITADVGLAGALKTNKISKAATAADQMNKILVEGIKATGIANDGKISSLDVIDLDAWMKANYHAEHLKLNGAQGFDVVEIWNATSPLFGADGVNEVADAIYSIGFGTKWGNSLFDEKGNWTETLDNTAAWLNGLLAQDLGAGTLHSASSGFSDPASFSSDIVASPGTVNADGVAGHLNVNHTNALALANGTVSFDFQANTLSNSDTVTLFSKDARGLGTGGHTQLYLDNGEMWLRMQSATGTKYYGAQLDDTIKAGVAYHVALTFGSGGLKLFVDGKKVLTEPNVKGNWKNNSEDIVFGGSGDWRNSKYPDHVHSVLDGAMSNIAIYNRALTLGEVAGLYGVNSDIVGAQPGEGTTPPVDQAPVDPTPVDPVPSDPTPSDPAPTDSAPVDPAPATPIPDPTPTDQAPVDTTPAPTNPAPATPTPSNPEPAPSAPTTPVDNGGLTLKGDAGDNKLTGTSKNDRIEGGDGNDKIFGGDGDDYIAAGAGRDGYVRGGNGLDIFEFSRGDGDIKIFDWQDSSDKIQLAGGLKFTDLTQSYSTYQGIGTITFATSSGDRLMFRDQKIGDINEGDFISSAGGGVAAPTASAPLVSGGFSPADYDTQFVGTNADDPYQGSSGRDWIDGSDGNDKINGNAGDDYIIAGAGKDGYVRGGTGSDIFQFSMGDGDVKIFDWEDGFDAIKLEGGLKFGDLKVSTSQHNGISTVVYSTSVGDRLMFRDVEVGNIDANDFI